MKRCDKKNRLGRIPAAAVVFLGGLALLIVLIGVLLTPEKFTQQTDALVLYCAAGLKGPVGEVARAYEKELGIPVQLSFGGSGTLLANIEIARRGDLYLPADDSYLQLAREKELVEETLPVARMQAVLAVAKGNPKRIRDLSDLERADVVLAQANPEAAAVGRMVQTALEQAGLGKRLDARTHVFKPTVNEIANDIKLGTVDAGFIWDTLLPLYPELETVPVDLLTNVQAKITIGVLRSSSKPAAALRFARYLNAPEKGVPVWRRQGFSAIAGDAWALRPEITLFSGAMLRPAIEETIQKFEEREGVEITRIYNGCGILVTQMKAGERPDGYFSCDTSFMVQVEDLFQDAEDISMNRLVIAVPKGNPRGIQSLKDLGQPKLRVGVGHPLKGAMGALTQKMLDSNGIYPSIQPNITVESPTGDFLVNQLRTGSLDAIIVYLSNTVESRDIMEAILIEIPSAVATQPIAVGRNSPFKQTMNRLRESIKSAQSKTRFESYGFRWKADSPPPQ